MSTIDPIISNIRAGIAAADQGRDAKHARLDALDLGELRNFTIGDDDARDAIERLVVCDKCGCIGDRGNARQGPVNQHDGTSPWICDKHWHDND